MSRNPVLAGRRQGQAARGAPASIACMAFVAAISIAFWVGAVWIVQQLMALMVGAG